MKLTIPFYSNIGHILKLHIVKRRSKGLRIMMVFGMLDNTLHAYAKCCERCRSNHSIWKCCRMIIQNVSSASNMCSCFHGMILKSFKLIFSELPTISVIKKRNLTESEAPLLKILFKSRLNDSRVSHVIIPDRRSLGERRIMYRYSSSTPTLMSTLHLE